MASSAATPVTSVARCMTLGRCSTNGVSGTFIDEQCGASGVGDRAHGVLVLLEVLAGARERRGEGQVVGVVAGAPDGAGEHAGGDQALLAADQQLGRRADQAVDGERPACGRSARPAAAAASAGRSARPRVATRSRASTTLSRSPALIRSTASRDDAASSRPARARRRRSATSVGARSASADARDGDRRAACASRRSSSPTSGPPRRPTTHLGHDERAPLGGVVGERERPERDRPGAGQVAPRRARPRAPTTSRHHASASREPVRARRLERERARPSRRGRRRAGPRPSPSGVGHAGSSASRAPGSSIGTVRTTSGDPLGRRCGVAAVPGQGGHRGSKLRRPRVPPALRPPSVGYRVAGACDIGRMAP